MNSQPIQQSTQQPKTVYVAPPMPYEHNGKYYIGRHEILKVEHDEIIRMRNGSK